MSQHTLNRHAAAVAAANFQAGSVAGMFPPSAAGMFNTQNLNPAVAMAAAVSNPSQKQHSSSHHTPQQPPFYGQFTPHHQSPVLPPMPQNRSPCLAKLQQLTNGLEPPSSVGASASATSTTSSIGTSSSTNRGHSSKQSSRNPPPVAPPILPSMYPYHPHHHQAANGTPTAPHMAATQSPSAGYYGRAPDMGRNPSATQHTAAGSSASHLMQYGQNPHHMLNYPGYGFMNQFMYHAAAASDHQRAAAVATPQPGAHPTPNMYAGYPQLGYPANYHR